MPGSGLVDTFEHVEATKVELVAPATEVVEGGQIIIPVDNLSDFSLVTFEDKCMCGAVLSYSSTACGTSVLGSIRSPTSAPSAVASFQCETKLFARRRTALIESSSVMIRVDHVEKGEPWTGLFFSGSRWLLLSSSSTNQLGMKCFQA